MEGGADVEEIFGMNSVCISELNAHNNINDIKTWLPNIIERFTDSVFNLKDVKHADVIYKAVDYIRNNYMNKITLDEVSSLVYLSSAYFSTIFGKEMGCNFNEYLNRVRIDMSKKLLLDDSVSLVDIPSAVGFESQSYYSRVFKNITGVTPGKFKSSRGHL